jgi:hypothetical protein
MKINFMASFSSLSCASGNILIYYYIIWYHHWDYWDYWDYWDRHIFH